MAQLREREFLETGFRRGLITEVDEGGPLYAVLYESQNPLTHQDSRFADALAIGYAVINYPDDGVEVIFPTDGALLEDFAEAEQARLRRGVFIHCHTIAVGGVFSVFGLRPGSGTLTRDYYCIEPKALAPDEVAAYLQASADTKYEELLDILRAS
jgi:hypothetical protein